MSGTTVLQETSTPVSIEARARKALIAVLLTLNVILVFFIVGQAAAAHKAEAIAGAALEREHRVNEQAMRLRASGAALALSCRDTGAALVEKNHELAVCVAMFAAAAQRCRQ